MPPRLRTRACAKLNLGLKILGVRADGYHDLRTVFQTISLADRVEVEIVRGRGIALTVTAEAGCEVAADATNLAWRAAEAAAAAWAIGGQIRIQLHKRIPVGAGLGGGSADAAAVLRLLAGRARRRPPLGAQLRLAAALGADVPAALLGGTVLGVGRGDEVIPLAELPGWECVVAMPRGGVEAVATSAAYARWDQLRAGGAGGAALTAAGSATLDGFQGWLVQLLPAFRLERNRGGAHAAPPRVQAGIDNDFVEVVFPLSPDFARIQADLRRCGARCQGLTGSGAAQFGLFATATAADAAAKRLGSRHRVWRARLLPRSRLGR